MQSSSKTDPNLPKEPIKPATPVVAKKPYRKPELRRLGLLKSVAGSGISW